jgi:hypothetical protein
MPAARRLARRLRNGVGRYPAAEGAKDMVVRIVLLCALALSTLFSAGCWCCHPCGCFHHHCLAPEHNIDGRDVAREVPEPATMGNVQEQPQGT